MMRKKTSNWIQIDKKTINGMCNDKKRAIEPN